MGTLQSHNSQKTAGHRELRPAPARELPARAGDNTEPSLASGREKSPCLHSPCSVLSAESKDLLRTKAKQRRCLAPTPAATGRNWCLLSQRGAFPGQAASTLSVQAAKLSNEAWTPEAKKKNNDKNK